MNCAKDFVFRIISNTRWRPVNRDAKSKQDCERVAASSAFCTSAHVSPVSLRPAPSKGATLLCHSVGFTFVSQWALKFHAATKLASVDWASWNTPKG